MVRTACRVYPLLLLAAFCATALFNGCSSEDPNLVGVDLVDAQFDSVLQTVELLAVTRYGYFEVTNEDVPPDAREVLYFGDRAPERSSILVNYDFSDLDDLFENEAIVDEDSISSVLIRLYVLDYYTDLFNEDGSDRIQKWYEAHELDEPFVVDDFPGPVPPHSATLLNTNSDQMPISVGADEVVLTLDETTFIDWYFAGAKVGVVIEEGAFVDSDPGLVGFASNEMAHAGSALARLDVGTTVGVVLTVEFEDTSVDNWLILPSEDVCTYESLRPPPADVDDGLLLRTHERNYPALSFDLSLLPANVLINRAILAVTRDTLRSYGTLGSIVVSEIDTTVAQPGANTILLGDLQDELYLITGQTSVSPALATGTYMEFNVTTSIQRFINGVYTGQKSFLLSAGERFTGTLSEGGMGPDFWWRTFYFYGSGEADPSLRPRMLITYTRDNDISGGGK